LTFPANVAAVIQCLFQQLEHLEGSFSNCTVLKICRARFWNIWR